MSKRNPYQELLKTRLGGYVIDEFIGEGGQAVVFKAHSAIVFEDVRAIKVFGLKENATGSLEKGLAELQRAALITHSAAVKLDQAQQDEVEFAGTKREVLLIPMAFTDLGSCQETPPFVGRQLTDDDFQDVINLLDGLEHIHARQVFHNDLKPANILRFNERIFRQDRIILRITDFGIASLMTSLVTRGMESRWMSPEFMSPEQLDQVMGSEKGDIYSLGATLFYMVTGRPPIEIGDGDTSDLSLWQRAHQEQKRPNALEMNPFCPPRLALLIMRMMSVDPRDRPNLSDCIREIEKLRALFSGRERAFEVPEDLAPVLRRKEFPLIFQPSFRGVFHPEVYAACGLNLFVLRGITDHPTLTQFQRLARVLATNFGDTFTMYETWGAYDLNVVLWTTGESIKRLQGILQEEFPRSRVSSAAAKKVSHVHGGDADFSEADTAVQVLAVQEDIKLPGAKPEKYLFDEYPASRKDRNIRAFSYIDIASSNLDNFAKVGIRDHILLLMQRLIKRREKFQKISIIEFSDSAHETEFGSTLLLVDYTVSEFSYLPEIPTRIIEGAESAVRTVTCFETGRVVIQSGKIMF